MAERRYPLIPSTSNTLPWSGSITCPSPHGSPSSRLCETHDDIPPMPASIGPPASSSFCKFCCAAGSPLRNSRLDAIGSYLIFNAISFVRMRLDYLNHMYVCIYLVRRLVRRITSWRFVDSPLCLRLAAGSGQIQNRELCDLPYLLL